MDPAYIMIYILIIFCCYISELIVFGVWYQINIKSNVSYFSFLKKMLAYYQYTLLHLPKLLEGKSSDSPDTSSLQWLYAVLMPIIFPSFMLLNSSWIYRIAVFALGLDALFEQLFGEGKIEATVHIDQWMRFLFDAEDRPERYESSKSKSISGTGENRPLTKEEIRVNRIFGFTAAGIGMVLLVIFILGSISNLKKGFQISPNRFIFFSDKKYDTVFLILLAVEIVLILCFLFGTPQDRAEAEAWAVKTMEQQTWKVANYLGFNKGIIIDPRLEEWEESIDRICKVLGIRHVAILSEHLCEKNMSGKIALSARSQEGIPTVIISTGEIDRQRTRYSSQMIYDMVRFLLGHELTHIRYKDYSIRKLALKEVGCLILTMVFFYLGIHLTLQLPEAMEKLAAACQTVLAIITMVPLRRFCDARYWRYVSEYRADRISASISGASDEAVTAMLLYAVEEEQADGRRKKPKKSQYHPKPQKRLKELKRKKKWSLSEYFRYAYKLIL